MDSQPIVNLKSFELTTFEQLVEAPDRFREVYRILTSDDLEARRPWLEKLWPEWVHAEVPDWDNDYFVNIWGEYNQPERYGKARLPLNDLTTRLRKAGALESLHEREDWASIGPSDELSEELEGFYELEYKYHRIRDQEWLGEPGQKERILAEMDTRLRELAASICDKLENVFAGWLEHHALTEPDKWAANWIETYLEEGYGYDDIVGFINGELVRYHTTLDDQLSYRDLEEMPALQGFAQDLYDEVYAGWEEDNPDPEEENPYEDMNLNEFLREYAASWGGSVQMFKIASDYLPPIVPELAEKVLFPLWLERWEAEGIRETRATIARAWEEMGEIASNPEGYELGDLTAKINYFLNLAHQTGSMLDYVEMAYPDVTADFLSVLSGNKAEQRWTRTPEGGTPPDWEREIAGMGAGAGAFTQDIRRRIARNLALGGPRESLLPTAESMAVDLCLKHGLSFEEAVEALHTCPIQEAARRPPAHVFDRASEMLGQIESPNSIGDTDIVDGWAIETHTLGCHREAGVPEDELWDAHWAVYDEYTQEKPKAIVLGDPADGVFATILRPRAPASGRLAFYEPTAESDGRKGPRWKTLDKHRTKLTDEERTEVMEREATWHHGPNGEATPAVWKSIIDDKPWYVTATHRAYQVRPTLKGAISAYHNGIKQTA